MPLARASELDRLFACPGSAVLPRAPDVEGRAAAWGTKVHAWAETGELPEGSDGNLLGRKILHAKVDRRVLWPATGEHEVPLAFNLVSKRAMRYQAPDPLPPGYNKKTHATAWKEAFDDEWVTGSLDYVGDLVGTYWVDDLKTGYDGRWEKYANQQLFYCLAWSIWEYGEVQGGRSTITHWRKYPLDKPPHRYGDIIDVDTLMAYMGKLCQLRETILQLRENSSGEKLNAVLVLGDHCRFCPSRASCPKFVGVAGDGGQSKDSKDN